MEIKDGIFTISLQEAPEHIKLGQVDFNNGKYEEAVKEFNSVLKVAPDNVEARVWLKKAQESLGKGGDGAGSNTGVKVKECLWMKMGMIDYRICTNDFNCITCDFDQ
jgi:hypothetical protein